MARTQKALPWPNCKTRTGNPSFRRYWAKKPLHRQPSRRRAARALAGTFRSAMTRNERITKSLVSSLRMVDSLTTWPIRPTANRIAAFGGKGRDVWWFITRCKSFHRCEGLAGWSLCASHRARSWHRTERFPMSDPDPHWRLGESQRRRPRATLPLGLSAV